MSKPIAIKFTVNSNESDTRKVTFYGTAARIEGVQAALLTREFSLSVDGVGKIRSAAISVDGNRYAAKIKSGEQAAAIMNYNKAARARKEAQKAAAEVAPKRKSFEEYEQANPADLCNLMATALQIARAKRGDTSELAYYHKQVTDLRAQLAKAEEAEKRIKGIFDKAAAMSSGDYAPLFLYAREKETNIYKIYADKGARTKNYDARVKLLCVEAER